MNSKNASWKKRTPKLTRNDEQASVPENTSRHRTNRTKLQENVVIDSLTNPSRFPKKEGTGKLKTSFHRKNFQNSRLAVTSETPERDNSKGFISSEMQTGNETPQRKSTNNELVAQSETATKGSRKYNAKKHQRRHHAETLVSSMNDLMITDEISKVEVFQTISDYDECFFFKDILKDVQQTKADFLDGTVLGIDVRYWLRRLEPRRKPLFPFTKPYDIGPKECITKNILLQELLRFRDLNVTVLLIFNGMDREAGKVLKECPSLASVPREACQTVPKDGRKRISHYTFSKTARFECESVINELLEICWEYRSSILSHVQCFRAPGDALPQLGYYHKLSLVQNVFGPPWLFWANTSIPSRIIVEIRDDIVYFTDRTPKIESITAKARVDPIILKEDGQLCGVATPMRFPTETMILHHAIGLLSPSLLDAALTLRISDRQPHFDSRELRCVLESILPLRTQLIRMLLKGHRNHSHVRWIRWHVDDKPTEVALPPAIDLDEWSLEGLEFSQPPNFITAIELIPYKTYTRNPYSSLIQYSHALHLKFLDVLGYFAHQDIRDGRQMFSCCERGVYSEALLNTHPVFAESMVLFIEFVRIKSLSWAPLQNAKDFSFFESPFKYQTNEGQMGSDELEAVVLSRLFSFVAIEFEDDMLTYEDIASQDLKAFWEILQTMRSTLLDVSEVISVVELPIVELPEIFLHEAFGYLPFKRVTSPFLGAIMEHIIVISRSGKFQEKTKEEKIQHLKYKFPHIKNLPYSIGIGFQWIEEVLRVVQHLFEYMEDEEPQSTKQYVCHLLKMLRQTKFYAEKIRQQLFD